MNPLFAFPGWGFSGLFGGYLGSLIPATVNGIFYALIFWVIYFLVKKLRNKTPVQTS